MARRHSGFRARMVSSGRKTFWFAGLSTSVNLPAVSSASLLTNLNAAALSLRPFTIIRSRGWVAWNSDQTAASESQVLHYGAIVVSDQAEAIGITAVPTPAADNGSSWFVYESGAFRLGLISAVGFDPQFSTMLKFDSKAMRKVEEGQTMITVAEADALSSGLDVRSFMRVLIKLH